MKDDTGAGVRYLFIVTRKNPDILARVQEHLHGDPRIEVLADRRYGDRRRTAAPHLPERRGGDRRRPTNVWNDLTIYPTLVAQRHVDSYADLERKLAIAARESQLLAEDNARLREEIGGLQRRLGAVASADAEFKADVTALLAQAEQALGGLITKFHRLAPDGRLPQKEPHLRSL